MKVVISCYQLLSVVIMVWVEILWRKIKIYEFKMTIFLMPMIFVLLIHARFNAKTQWFFHLKNV